MIEYIYTHEPTGTEIYVQRQGSTVKDLYFHHDAFFLMSHKGKFWFNPKVVHGRRASLCKFNVKNKSQFVHVKPADVALDLLIDQGFSCHGQDPYED